MKTFAIIETGGKQYRVSAGDTIRVEKLEASEKGDVIFDKVLLSAAGDAVRVGTPYVSGARVEGKVLGEGRERKKLVFRYHSKTRYRKKKTHRQHYTQVRIVKA
jgi:large subunit ribosomal protein L21